MQPADARLRMIGDIDRVLSVAIIMQQRHFDGQEVSIMIRTAAFLVVRALAICVAVTGVASAQLAGTMNDVVEHVGNAGNVDWTTGVVTAAGTGAPPSQPANPAQARAMAERAAQVVAYRNLLEAVKGVRVDASTTVANFIAANDTIKTQVNGIIQAAMILDKKYMPDGSVEVTVGMRLSGALADALLPKTTPAAPPAGATSGQVYSGLIVDARGLGVRPALAPKILSEDGKEVYGSASINRDLAVREGMAVYMEDLAAAQANDRVKDKPLVVKAVKVSGDARVDIVISDAGASAIQGAAQNLSMLDKCKVIILVD